MKILRYRLDKEGNIDACGYADNLPFEVDKNTPFQSISESINYRKVNGKWQYYDSTWEFENFNVRVTIPDVVILYNDYLIALRNHVILLKEQKKAEYYSANGNQIMYFNELLPEHEYILKQYNEILIEKKQWKKQL